MSKVALYLIGGLFIFLLLLGWQFRAVQKKYKHEKAEKERLKENQRQLLAEKTQDLALILTRDEWLRVKDDSISKLLRSLAIKPKQVIKYIDRIVTEKTTDTIEVISEALSSMTWKLSDGGDCWKWAADAELVDFDLNVNRTLFEYSNKSTEVYWWERKKILFLRIGRKLYYQKLTPQCGTVSTRSIEIKKK
jgi:hypothetical protein